MSSSSNQNVDLCKILPDMQKSIARAVDLAKNQRETFIVKENDNGESNILSELHLKNNQRQSNLAEKNQVESEINIHELQREIKLVREKNEKMLNINLTLKRKIIDFEKSNQLIAHHILLSNVKNLTKSNKKLQKSNKKVQSEKIKETKLLTEANSKIFTLKMQMEKMRNDILKIKTDMMKKTKKKKNCVAVKYENINPEDFDFEHNKVKIEEIQPKSEIKTEYQLEKRSCKL